MTGNNKITLFGWDWLANGSLVAFLAALFAFAIAFFASRLGVRMFAAGRFRGVARVCFLRGKLLLQIANFSLELVDPFGKLGNKGLDEVTSWFCLGRQFKSFVVPAVAHQATVPN